MRAHVKLLNFLYAENFDTPGTILISFVMNDKSSKSGNGKSTKELTSLENLSQEELELIQLIRKDKSLKQVQLFVGNNYREMTNYEVTCRQIEAVDVFIASVDPLKSLKLLTVLILLFAEHQSLRETLDDNELQDLFQLQVLLLSLGLDESDDIHHVN